MVETGIKTIAAAHSQCPLWVKSRHVRCKSVMSALPPKADMCSATRHVRFVPKADICSAAKKILFDHLVGRHEQRSGTVRPSAFAALRLITSSNLVGCNTGSSAGLAPLRILPV